MLDQLPLDVVERIALYAGPRSPLSLRRVCRKLHGDVSQLRTNARWPKDSCYLTKMPPPEVMDALWFIQWDVCLMDTIRAPSPSTFAGVTNLHLQTWAHAPPESSMKGLRAVYLTDYQCYTLPSCLQDVEKVSILRARDGLDVSPLKHASNVILQDMYGIRNLDALSDVQEIGLDSINDITSVPKLGGEGGEVLLIDCVCLQDIRSIGSPAKVNITGCMVSNVSALSAVTSVTFNACCLLEDVSPLARVREVTIICCYSVTDIRPLANVYKLRLRRIPICHGLDGLHGVTHLYLDGSLLAETRISGVENATTVILRNWPALTDISCLSSVKNARIIGCSNVRDADRILPDPSAIHWSSIK